MNAAEGNAATDHAGCVVAVDVGNTAVKLALQTSTMLQHREIRIGTSGWEFAVIGWVRDKLGSLSAASSDLQWRIASVHAAAAARLRHAIDSSEPTAQIQLVSWRDVPIELQIDFPERVGIDRLLSAFAAWRRYARSAVVIDAGSAITADWVSGDGAFCGGSILPGLALQARSLVMGTEALPQIELNSDLAIELPAKNTGAAIRAGIVLGSAAALDGLIGRYAEQAHGGPDDRSTHAHPPFQVLLTGGDARTLSPHLRQSHELIPNLVCEGLLQLC